MAIAAKAVLEAVEQTVRVQLAVFAEQEQTAYLAKSTQRAAQAAQEQLLRGQLAQQQSYRQKLVQSLSQGLVDEVQFAQLQQGYRAKMERLQGELTALSTAQWGERQASKVAQEQGAQLRTVLQEGLTGKLARALIERIVVGPDKTLEIQFLFKEANRY